MSKKDEAILKDIVDGIQAASKEQTTPYDTTAEVTRVDGNTAYVHIPGGVDETPVTLTQNAKAGDVVQVRVSGGRAWIVGNATAPPTDDTTALNALSHATTAADAAASAVQSANTAQEAAGRASSAASRAEGKADNAAAAASAAQTSASNASEYAARALGNLASVESVAETLSWITAHGTMALTQDQQLDPTHVYFVQDNNGDYTVGGTRYSIVTEPDAADLSTYYELSINQSLNNYVATHLAVDGEGLWLLPDAGGNKVLIATGAGSTYTTAGTYIIEKINGADVSLAKFLATGIQIGQNVSGKTRTEISGNGMRIVQNINGTDTLIAHLGYGPGYDSGGGTDDAPFYVLGMNCSAYGNYCVVEGLNTTASYCCHAEGEGTTAEAGWSHSEGYNTSARNTYCHAEGYETSAEGPLSHTEGYLSGTLGSCSHAQNWGTSADKDYQTAIGKWNEVDTESTTSKQKAFIIGNGTGNNARSNAFSVDWEGFTEIAGDVWSDGNIEADGDMNCNGNMSPAGNLVAGGDVSDGTGNVLGNKADKSGLFKVVTVSKTISSLAAHTNNNIGTLTVASGSRPAGMTLVGVVGYNSTNYRVSEYKAQKNGDHSIEAGVTNTTAAAISSSFTCTWYLLYIKGTSA